MAPAGTRTSTGGTLTIELDDDAFRGRLGDLAVVFVAGEGDAFTVARVTRASSSGDGS